MNKDMRKIAIDRLQITWLETSKLYNNTALLLNACDIAKKRYVDMKDNIELNTITNVPDEFKLSIETGLETTFTNDGLITEYSSNLLEEINLNYLVRTISIMDACFEDIYEALIPLQYKELEQDKIDKNKLIINPWSNDKLRKFFIEELSLKQIEGKLSTADMIFDRYEELRIIRHAVIHNQGKLSKHQNKRLDELSKKLPLDKTGGSFAKQEFIKTGYVKITCYELFLLRKWLYEVISFFMKMVEIS
ncbi:hypothetical protein LGK97_18455 [Clostridium sp. CS001]|uniref:hypothetical protein n=1 Tax=Clostridium sp. CS001 TaxID=2880648 RepID=UPI001CF22CD8|nr:hypothetical protein [Clostridium sp. CS001]MCB2291698.1 hypothetical protein [Clostridium sp. CS001]